MSGAVSARMRQENARGKAALLLQHIAISRIRRPVTWMGLVSLRETKIHSIYQLCSTYTSFALLAKQPHYLQLEEPPLNFPISCSLAHQRIF